MSIQVCRDVSDAVVLYLPQRLYLKSFAKLNISVQLPAHKIYGKSISNWELTEKLRKMILPDTFSLLKVSKHSSEVIRFDAELESRDKLDRVLSQLDNRVIQLNDYPEPLKVKVSEAKTDFPIKHSWDSFFRDATDMDEMKPGERPDTIHIANLPISWFINVHDSDKDALPTESIFRKVFEKFGAIRRVDVPISDPFRTQMKEAMRGITITAAESSMYFEGYIQFSEYMGFVRCMDALRGRKLVRKKDDISEWCHIMVDFDKTKHMTDAAVKRRAIVRERLIMRQRAKEEEERIEKDKIAKREAKERQNIERFEREKLVKMREREEKRKKKRLAKLLEKDKVDVNKKLAEKQQKLLHEQKRLQAIRLIEELFKRIELRPELQRNRNHERYYDKDEISTRYRIVERFKRHQEQQVEAQREMVKQALDGRIVIRSALETKKPRQESPISSLSSEDERTKKRVKIEKLSSPEREFDYNKTIVPGMYPYGFPYHFACAPPPGYPFPQTSLYYPRGHFSERRPGRGRGRGRGVRARMPYFDGPDASQLYYQYFKKLREQERGHGERSHSRRRSRSRTRTRSRSRSRSRSRRRSYSRSRSRSRSRNRRSRSRRTRSRSRRSSSRSRRSKSSRSRSRSRRRSESRSRRSTSRSKSRQRERSAEKPTSGEQNACEASEPRARSRSWSLPKGSELRKSWSKSPKNTSDIINPSREDFLS